MTQQGYTILDGANAPRMAERTTLRLGGRVLAEVSLLLPEAAEALPDIAKRLGGRLVSLGAGSNILAGEGPLALVLVRDGTPGTVEVLEDNGKRALVRATGAAKLPVLLKRTADLDLAGLEGLAGIPGTVGGSVAMNAGSFGQTVGNVLESMTVVTVDGTVKTFRRDEVDMGYRHMALPGCGGWFLILEAVFGLPRVEAGTVAVLGKEYLAKKKATQPVGAASAGCVFRNPSPDNPAGKLLDAAGFKGKRLGGMKFSTLHANFLLNEGTGTSGEALELIALAREEVKARTGIWLEPEVKLWV